MYFLDVLLKNGATVCDISLKIDNKAKCILAGGTR